MASRRVKSSSLQWKQRSGLLATYSGLSNSPVATYSWAMPKRATKASASRLCDSGSEAESAVMATACGPRARLAAQKDGFVLKGAMLFLAWEGRLHRPTKDLDLLGFGSPDVEDVTHRIRDVCAVQADDGIVFDLAGIHGERIKEDAEYEGVRVRVPASLDGARVSMQIDVGFGDLVDPPPAELTFPVLLPLDAPVLWAYPPEAVIAEKFHAMVILGIANSLMKDFFDIWTLAQTHGFDIEMLAGSVRSTFERRRTPLPETVPMALTGEFLRSEERRV